MAKSDDDKPLTPDDMRLWLNREVRMVTKAAELQLREATDFVTAYLAGKLSPEQAEERMTRYDERWGEAKLEGTMKTGEMTDREILAKLDADREQAKTSWEESTHRRDLPGKHQSRS